MSPASVTLLQDLAHLRGPLPLDILGAEDVDRDGQLVRGCVAGTGSDRHVYGRKRDRLDHEREVLTGRLRPAHDHLDALRHVPEEPHAHRVRARGYATDLIAPLLVGGGARPDRVHAHGRARERRTLGIRHTSADGPALSAEPVRQRDQQGYRAEHGERKALYHEASSSRATEFTTASHAKHSICCRPNRDPARQDKTCGGSYKKPPSARGHARRLSCLATAVYCRAFTSKTLTGIEENTLSFAGTSIMIWPSLP